jgi:hypothetical protein
MTLDKCYNGCGRTQIGCTLRHLLFDWLFPIVGALALGIVIGWLMAAVANKVYSL